jgi:flagellar protein FlaI
MSEDKETPLKSSEDRGKKLKEVLSNLKDADSLVNDEKPDAGLEETGAVKGDEDRAENNSGFLSALNGKSGDIRHLLQKIGQGEGDNELKSFLSELDLTEADVVVEEDQAGVAREDGGEAESVTGEAADSPRPLSAPEVLSEELQHPTQEGMYSDADTEFKSVLSNLEEVVVPLDEAPPEGELAVEGAAEGVDKKADDNAVLLSALDGKSEELKHLLQGVEQLDTGIEQFMDRLEATINEYSIPEGFKEIEKYFVNKPYALVNILYNDEQDEYLYFIVEPKLTDVERFFLADIEDKLGVALLFTEVEGGVEGADKERILRKKIEEVVERYHIEFEPDSLKKVSYYLVRDLILFGKIDVLMRDRFVEDISCDGYNIPIYVYHWKYGSTKTNIAFNESELDSFVVKVAQKGGKHLSLSDPLVGLTLEDGSRAQVSLGSEITTRGSTFTIRRFREVLITASDLIRWGTFTAEEMAYLWLAVENGKSVLFVGGTASGKTTSLNAMALFIPQTAKIVTIEDTRELRLPHDNWIPGITRAAFMGSERGTVDMYELLKVALRQRPEYLIVGEVRGKEAMTLFQAMSTGHTSFSTFHADSVDATIHRLEYPPLSIPRSMLQSLDIFCIQAQVFIGKQRVRRNLDITENLGIDPTTKNIKTRRIFEWNPAKDAFEGLSVSLPPSEKSASHVTIMVSKVLKEIGRFNGWSGVQLWNEFEKRARLLKAMAEREIAPQDFISTIRTFQANPEKALKEYGL